MLPDPNVQKTNESEVKTEAQKAEVNSAEKQEQQEVWKDGKPFNPEWAAKKIEELTNENKALKPKAKRADELEAEARKRADAELSETERLRKENEEIKAENARTKDNLIRNQAVLAAGLPADFAKRLTGTTEEELLADAKELAKALPQLKTAPKVSPTNPGNSNTNETEAQKRTRLFGAPANPFDFDNVKAQGGGVVNHK